MGTGKEETPITESALALLRALSRRSLDGPSLERETGLAPDCINSAIDQLEEMGLVDTLRMSTSTETFRFRVAYATASGRERCSSMREGQERAPRHRTDSAERENP